MVNWWFVMVHGSWLTISHQEPTGRRGGGFAVHLSGLCQEGGLPAPDLASSTICLPPSHCPHRLPKCSWHCLLFHQHHRHRHHPQRQNSWLPWQELGRLPLTMCQPINLAAGACTEAAGLASWGQGLLPPSMHTQPSR